MLKSIICSIILSVIATSNNYSPIQSSQQSFYFIEDIENIKKGDLVICYCDDRAVGSRVWKNAYTDIPAMGKDEMEYSKHYCDASSTVHFKVQKQDGVIYDLFGNVPDWSNNGLHIISYLSETPIPERFSLNAPFPNPFNPITQVRFSLPDFTLVSVFIYNSSGQLIHTLVDKEIPPGEHNISWDASNQSSGIYFLHFNSGLHSEIHKLVLMK